MATPAITATTVAGDNIVEAGDNSGAIALQNVINTDRKLPGRGRHRGPDRVAVGLCGDLLPERFRPNRTRSPANQTTQDDRLHRSPIAQSRPNSGVNLDEELTNLTTYQQAYSAGARMLTVVDQLYQTLLQIQ